MNLTPFYMYVKLELHFETWNIVINLHLNISYSVIKYIHHKLETLLLSLVKDIYSSPPPLTSHFPPYPLPYFTPPSYFRVWTLLFLFTFISFVFASLLVQLSAFRSFEWLFLLTSFFTCLFWYIIMFFIDTRWGI